MPREDNAFNMRRFANMFSGGGREDPNSPFVNAARRFSLAPERSVSITQPEAEQVQDETDPIMSALSKLRGGQAANAYREHISKMPTQQEYAPSKTRRFGGALAAAAGAFNDPKMGAAIGEQIIGAPYRNALEGWQMKGAGLKEQANIESSDVKSQLEYVKAIRQAQLDAKKYGLDERNVAATELRAQTDVARQKAQEDNYARQGWTFYDTADGMRVGDNTTTGEHKIFGPSLAGRTAANAERGTNIAGYNAETGRIQAGTAQANLGMRGQEFGFAQEMGRGNLAARQEGLRQSGMNAGSAGFVPAGEQYGAEAMATAEALKQNPDWKGWVDDQGLVKKPGAYWGSGPSGSDPNYQQFLDAVETAKQRILGTRRPGIGAAPGRVGPINFNDLPD